MKQILFLCTGNYYRSRFSEEYFNHISAKAGLAWRADSMGLKRDFKGNGNVGSIAQNTLDKLDELGIQPIGADRMPKHVFLDDIHRFDRVVAVSLDEHKPMLEALWSVSDISKVEYV